MKVKAPPPDPNVGLAAKNQSEIARLAEERAQANDLYFRENFAPRYLEQMDQQLGMSRELQDFQMGLARRYDDRFWDTTAKYQDKFYGMVDQYSAPDEQERQAGMAGADVAQGFAMANRMAGRGLARMGVNPSSDAYASMMRSSANQEGLARAGAMTMARQAAKDMGIRYTAAAAGMGGELLGATQGAAGGALGAGQAGTGAIAGAQSGFNANSAQWNSAMGLASNNWNNVGQIGMDLTRMRFDANKANAQGMNQMLGMGAGMLFSDRRLKKDVRFEGTRPDGLNVYSFQYIWGGPRRLGVMADEVQEIYPHAVSSMHGFSVVNYAQLR